MEQKKSHVDYLDLRVNKPCLHFRVDKCRQILFRVDKCRQLLFRVDKCRQLLFRVDKRRQRRELKNDN